MTATSIDRPPRARRRKFRLSSLTKILLVLPALALFVVFYVTPVVAGIVISFFRWNGLEPIRFVGFSNYERLLSDPLFPDNVRITLLVVAVSLLVILPLALLGAVCLSGPRAPMARSPGARRRPPAA